MNSKTVILIIFIIAAIGLGIRLYQVEKVPPFLSNDEISIAYDSYSISKTGKDEHNHLWPISFESHGTYKAPLYSYILAPLIMMGGNTDLVAKIPSILFGTLTIIFLGLLTIELTGKKELGIISALLICTAPWHIYESRMVLEANVALFFLVLGMWLFVKAVNNPKSARVTTILGMISMVISMYGYHAEWGLVPMLLIFILVRYFHSFGKKLVVLIFCVGILLSTPLFVDAFSHLGTGARANTQMIWNEQETKKKLDKHHFLGTKVLIVNKIFISNYLSYINPGYLFFTGLGLFPGEHPYQVGLFLTPALVALIFGLYYFNQYIDPKHKRLFMYWLFISPIIPAFTLGGNNSLRNLASILPYVILMSIGFYCLWKRFKFAAFIIVLLSVFILIFDSFIYFRHYPLEMAETFQGYKPVAQYLTPFVKNSEIIKVDFRFGLKNQFIGVPQLYFAYYEQWDPAILQNRKVSKEGVWYNNLLVTSVNWSDEEIIPNVIYVVSNANTPPPQSKIRLNLLQSFTDLSGRGSFDVWQGI